MITLVMDQFLQQRSLPLFPDVHTVYQASTEARDLVLDRLSAQDDIWATQALYKPNQRHACVVFIVSVAIHVEPELLFIIRSGDASCSVLSHLLRAYTGRKARCVQPRIPTLMSLLSRGCGIQWAPPLTA